MSPYPYINLGGPTKRERVIVLFKGKEMYRGLTMVYRQNFVKAVKLDGTGQIQLFDITGDTWQLIPEPEKEK